MQRLHLPRAAWAALALTAIPLAWDASGLDLAAAAAFGSPQGFGLRDHWLLSTVLHDAARRLAWAVELALCLAVAWPFGPLRRLPPSRRLQLAVTPLLATLAVSGAKAWSPVSCPWDLQPFGGIATFVPHWALANDGGPGRCFPAGHASAGFAFIGGFFAWRGIDAAQARRWLGASIAAGLVFGLAQQARGAHFASHTLWTAWLCVAVAWAVHALWPAPERAGA